jgi:hypothetical protein
MLSWGLRCATVGFVLAAGALAVACASNASNAGYASENDGGGQDASGDASPFGDGGFDAPFDAPMDAPDAPAPPTTALFIQGSPSLPDVRLCWGVGTATPPAVVPFPGTGAMPASNYPGIPVGGAAALGDARDLAVSGVTLYAIDAQNLARLDQGHTPQYTCADLICGQGSNPAFPCLRYNYDYWPVSTAALAVHPLAANVVALSGCLPAALDPAATTDRCGASWTALSGNLHADIVTLDGNSGGAGQMAVQAAQLSPGIAALVGDAGAVVTFGPQDAADASVIATLTSEGTVQPSAQLVSVGTNLAAYGALGFGVDIRGLDGGAGHLWMSLAQSQQLVDPTRDPTAFFGQQRPYVVAVLGDPNAPHAFGASGTYDGKGLHVLVVAAAAPSVLVDP